MTLDQVDRSTLTNAAIAALEREDPSTGPAHAVLRLMMEATSPATETEFFEFLVEKIATTLGVYRVFVTECLNYPTTSVSMLASWAGDKITKPNRFALAGTPCHEVITGGKVCFYPKDVGDLYPDKKKRGHQSYIGVPIFETGGPRVIGHIAIFDKKDMTDGILRDQFLVDTVLRIFAERTSAEIQRMRVSRALRDNAENYRVIAHVARRSSLSELSTAIAHEINQPLASILTYAQACLRLSRTDPSAEATIDDALKSIASNAERAGDIIRRVKNFVRNAEPNHTEHDINDAVRDVILLMQPEASRHGIELDCELNDALETVSLDEIQIQQVLVNLIQNSIDSIRAYPEATPKVSIKTENRGNAEVLITVKDFGGGVSPELVSSLFDPFTTSKPDGLGIGLAISQSIVDAHDGRLTYEPVHPNGAQFCVFLPTTPSTDRG